MILPLHARAPLASAPPRAPLTLDRALQRRLALALALAAIGAATLGCGEEGEGAAPPGERALLVGQWLIEDPVSPVTATFQADGAYRVEQDFGATPFVQEGAWALDRPHTLVQTHAAGRSTEAIFVDADRLVISGVLARVGEASGAGIEGAWETSRTVETAGAGGELILSSHTERAVTFDATGRGAVRTSTERGGPDGAAEPPVVEDGTLTWVAADDGATFTLSGDLRGDFTLIGDQLVPLDGAYQRQ